MKCLVGGWRDKTLLLLVAHHDLCPQEPPPVRMVIFCVRVFSDGGARWWQYLLT